MRSSRPYPKRRPSPALWGILATALAVSTAAASGIDEKGRSPEPPSATALPVPGSLGSFFADCDRLMGEERLLEARTSLALALRASGLGEAERGEIRRRLEAIHDITFFSPRVVPGDPFTDRYLVEPGDTLARIASRLELEIDWRLLQRINRLAGPSQVRAFAPIKVVRGPFHARVNRRAFRLDLYVGPSEQSDRWLFVRSFPVGLGEEDTTPVGTFVVRPGGKVTDPFWTDPRNGTWYAPGAADNPIGDRWIGLEGLGESASLSGYGLHGTVDPASIGEARSMGCVRLLSDDVHLLFELLSEGVSRVFVEP